MAVLSAVQVADLCRFVGLSEPNAVMAVAIAWAESGLRTDAVGYNPGPRPGTIASRDRGLWQINDYYHSEVSDACAFNPSCCAAQMARISSGGTNWNPWSTYTNGAYRQFVTAASVAANISYGQPAGTGYAGTVFPGEPSGSDLISVMLRELHRGLMPWQPAFHLIESMLNDVANVQHNQPNAGISITGDNVRH